MFASCWLMVVGCWSHFLSVSKSACFSFSFFLLFLFFGGNAYTDAAVEHKTFISHFAYISQSFCERVELSKTCYYRDHSGLYVHRARSHIICKCVQSAAYKCGGTNVWLQISGTYIRECEWVNEWENKQVFELAITSCQTCCLIAGVCMFSRIQFFFRCCTFRNGNKFMALHPLSCMISFALSVCCCCCCFTLGQYYNMNVYFFLFFVFGRY